MFKKIRNCSQFLFINEQIAKALPTNQTIKLQLRLIYNQLINLRLAVKWCCRGLEFGSFALLTVCPTAERVRWTSVGIRLGARRVLLPPVPQGTTRPESCQSRSCSAIGCKRFLVQD